MNIKSIQSVEWIIFTDCWNRRRTVQSKNYAMQRRAQYWPCQYRVLHNIVMISIYRWVRLTKCLLREIKVKLIKPKLGWDEISSNDFGRFVFPSWEKIYFNPNAPVDFPCQNWIMNIFHFESVEKCWRIKIKETIQYLFVPSLYLQ